MGKDLINSVCHSKLKEPKNDMIIQTDHSTNFSGHTGSFQREDVCNERDRATSTRFINIHKLDSKGICYTGNGYSLYKDRIVFTLEKDKSQDHSDLSQSIRKLRR